MVTEYCEIGSLDRMLRLELKEPAISFIIGQVLQGLAYLHGLNRVHRDIKTSNILVNSQGQVKIADLGLCEDIKNGPINGKMSGSKYWLAPEVIARQPYSTPVDIWNLGLLCCAMVTKTAPNGTMHPIKAMYFTAVQGISISDILPRSQDWSDHFRDFLSQCCKMDPSLRPTATTLLQHPFLKSGKRSDLVPLVNACIIAGYIV
jgi:serine/threonine kinase 4